MRILSGLLCIGMTLYVLKFTVQMGYRSFRIIIPMGGANIDFCSVYWLLIPLIYGLYLIVTGEIDYVLNKKQTKI